MKYFVRAFALSLTFAGAMMAQPTQTASNVANHHVASVHHVAFASGPTPVCDPDDPTCVPFE
jgi:hypothetical protein